MTKEFRIIIGIKNGSTRLAYRKHDEKHTHIYIHIYDPRYTTEPPKGNGWFRDI